MDSGALNAIGVSLEIAGLGLAFAGAWQSWHEIAEPGERPWSFLARWISSTIKAGWQWAEGQVRRLIRRPKAQTIYPQGIESQMKVGGNLTVRVGYGPLPGDMAEAVAALDDRTRRLRRDIEAAGEFAEGRLSELRSELTQSVDRLAADIEELRRQNRRVTTAGLKLQFVGFPIVLIGLVLQGISSL